MSFQSFVTQQLASINTALNALATNAKRIFELPEQETLVVSSWLHVDNDGVSEKLRIEKIIEGVVQTYVDRLIYVGELDIDGNDVTVPEGVQALINNITYFTTTDFTFTIEFAATGLARIDIIVMDVDAQLTVITGVETDGVAVRPNIPLNTVLVTQINVTEDNFTAVNGLYFKGEFDTLANLESVHPTALPGSYAFVHDGDPAVYYYSGETAAWFTNSGGGGTGYTPINFRTVYDGTSVTVPTGFVATRVVDLNDINNDVSAGTIVADEMPITGGVSGNVYLIDGYTP